MRYDYGKEQWVEISGASQLSMRELNALYAGDLAHSYTIIASVVKASHIRDRHGEPIDLTRSDEIDRLTLHQYDWIRARIVEAARDEIIDPEA